MSGANDWFARPSSAFFVWCLPLGIGVAALLSGLAPRLTAAIWAFLFVWMGAGCVANAVRCRRLHCYISGPVFLLGALVMVLMASGVALSPHALNNAISFTLLFALLSFLPEMIWRKYV